MFETRNVCHLTRITFYIIIHVGMSRAYLIGESHLSSACLFDSSFGWVFIWLTFRVRIYSTNFSGACLWLAFRKRVYLTHLWSACLFDSLFGCVFILLALQGVLHWLASEVRVYLTRLSIAYFIDSPFGCVFINSPFECVFIGLTFRVRVYFQECHSTRRRSHPAAAATVRHRQTPTMTSRHRWGEE